MKRKFIKFKPAVKPLIPYFLAAMDLIPYEKLEVVRGYNASLTRDDDAYATIWRHTNGRHSIGIRMSDKVTKMARPGWLKVHGKAPRALWDLLSAFAHELAHLTHWEHTPEHMQLEARIMLRFVRVCKAQKINNVYKRRIK